MKVLVACEESQTVCKSFRARGHEAYSCDILPCSGGHPEWHIQDDVLLYLNEGWDLMIAHPPCTYLSYVGIRWFKPEYKERFPTREQDQQEAIKFFMQLANAPVPHKAIENPVGIMNKLWRKADQLISPEQFGHPFKKRTALWLTELPKLTPTQIVANAKPYQLWELEDNAMQKTREERSRFRSKFWTGIAEAMADQWGNL